MSNQLLLRRRAIMQGKKRPDYLKFEAQEDGCTIAINKVGNPPDPHVEYSINKGAFVPYDTFGTVINIDKGDTVEWRRIKGYESTRFCSENSGYRYQFATSGVIVGTGMVTSLLQADGNVTTIGSCAFYGAIKSAEGFTCELNLPEAVTSINGDAFRNCDGFTSSVVFSDGLTNIGSSAFFHCTGLIGDLYIPDSVTSIRTDCFRGCTGFNGIIHISENLTEITDRSFMECRNIHGNLEIPEGVTRIGSQAFNSCDNLNGTLTLPSTLVTIGDYAFAGTKLVGNLNIPNGVTTIGYRAFQSCSTFDGTFTLPNTVTSIGEQAFSSCSNMTGQLNLPSGLTAINANIFNRCSKLTGSVVIPNGITSIGAGAFKDCTGLDGTLTIPSGVTTIGNEAFRGCSNLTGTLTIPNGVTSIGNYAFNSCNKLTGNIVIPSGVTSIGDYTFNDCSGFDGTLTIPNSVTSIGGYAFKNCSGLIGDIAVPSGATINGSSFEGCKNITNITCYGWTINSSSPFVQCGNLTGDFTCNGDIIYTGSSSPSARNNIRVKKAVVNGNFNDWSSYQPFVKETKIIRISGNYSNQQSNPSGLYYGGNTTSIDFLEIGGTYSSYLTHTSNSDYSTSTILHFGYNGIAGTVDNLGTATAVGKVSKIYVGDGSSQAADQAVLDLYLADADWSQLSDKLDLWYNYQGEYKE